MSGSEAGASGAGSIGVLLVEDHALVREGLSSLLASREDVEVVGEAAEAEEAVATCLDLEPDVVLLDLRLGDGSGVDVARQLREHGSLARILVLSVHDGAHDLREALRAGADGYLLKSTSGEALIEGIRRCRAGETVIGEEFLPKLLDDVSRGAEPGRAEITPREQEVLELVADGLGNREVAERLGMSTRTAQKHVEHLCRKLGVHDRTELVSRAFRRGMLG